MHLQWWMDPRPAGRVICVYALVSTPHGRIGAIDLERALVATGKVRAPKVLASAGMATITANVKADDDTQARADALTIVDVAARAVEGLALGEPTMIPAVAPLGRPRP